MENKDARITLFKEYFTNIDRELMKEFKQVTGIKRIQNWLVQEFNIQFDYLIQDSQDISYASRLLQKAHYTKREWVSEKMRIQIKKHSKDEMFMIRFALRKTCVNGQNLVYNRNQLLSKKCKEEIGYWDLEETDVMTFKTGEAADKYQRNHFSKKENIEIYEYSGNKL